MELLLDQGAGVYPVVSRFPERAAKYGKTDVRVFLERSTHQVPGCFDKEECTLHCAMSTGHERVVRVLGQFGIAGDRYKCELVECTLF